MVKEYKNAPIKVPRFEESAGFYTNEKRSQLMSKIRSKNTKPELRFRQALFACGVRYRLHNSKLPGKPDISNHTKRFAIFIDGEFWHGHNWKDKKGKLKTNRGFWIPKIERNIQRDNQNTEMLIGMGYEVFRFWANEVKNDLGICLNKVLAYLTAKC